MTIFSKPLRNLSMIGAVGGALQSQTCQSYNFRGSDRERSSSSSSLLQLELQERLNRLSEHLNINFDRKAQAKILSDTQMYGTSESTIKKDKKKIGGTNSKDNRSKKNNSDDKMASKLAKLKQIQKSKLDTMSSSSSSTSGNSSRSLTQDKIKNSVLNTSNKDNDHSHVDLVEDESEEMFKNNSGAEHVEIKPEFNNDVDDGTSKKSTDSSDIKTTDAKPKSDTTGTTDSKSGKSETETKDTSKSDETKSTTEKPETPKGSIDLHAKKVSDEAMPLSLLKPDLDGYARFICETLDVDKLKKMDLDKIKSGKNSSNGIEDKDDVNKNSDNVNGQKLLIAYKLANVQNTNNNNKGSDNVNQINVDNLTLPDTETINNSLMDTFGISDKLGTSVDRNLINHITSTIVTPDNSSQIFNLIKKDISQSNLTEMLNNHSEHQCNLETSRLIRVSKEAFDKISEDKDIKNKFVRVVDLMDGSSKTMEKNTMKKSSSGGSNGTSDDSVELKSTEKKGDEKNGEASSTQLTQAPYAKSLSANKSKWSQSIDPKSGSTVAAMSSSSVRSTIMASYSSDSNTGSSSSSSNAQTAKAKKKNTSMSDENNNSSSNSMTNKLLKAQTKGSGGVKGKKKSM